MPYRVWQVDEPDEGPAGVADARIAADIAAAVEAMDIPPIADEQAMAQLHALADGQRHRVLAEHEQEMLAAIAEAPHGLLEVDLGPHRCVEVLGSEATPASVMIALDGLTSVGLVDYWRFVPQDVRIRSAVGEIVVVRAASAHR